MKFVVKKKITRGINKGSVKTITKEFENEVIAKCWKEEMNTKEYNTFEVLEMAVKLI